MDARGPIALITDVGHVSRAELRDRGRDERARVPRRSHAGWSPPPDRRDPLGILAESNATREPELVPIRFGRMLADPFSFFRGAPAVMASDLACTPRTTVWPQICGDAHLLNYGTFATPERTLVFDLNDFDETLPGPFEWDLKRLTTSLVVAARANDLGDEPGRRAAVEAVRRYARAMDKLTSATTLGIWYTKTQTDDIMRLARGRRLQRRLTKTFRKARRRDSMQALSKLTAKVDGRRMIVDDPPLVVHHPTSDDEQAVRDFWERYTSTLRGDRRHLVDQYEIIDVARKVVGVGSVGTRCFVALLAGRAASDYLLLQVKEAQASVLEPYLGRSEFDHQGERVVTGQRMMQAASDLLLGWGTSVYDRDFYVRQLRDMKYSVDAPNLPGDGFMQYAGLCGSTLARAHANTCDPALVAGYVGDGEALADALVEFAVGYADQTEADHARLVQAVHDGEVQVVVERRR